MLSLDFYFIYLVICLFIYFFLNDESAVEVDCLCLKKTIKTWIWAGPENGAIA